MITLAEYKKLGYRLIPEDGEFMRYMAKAWLTACKYTFNRITAKKLSEYNRRGICELAELYYCDDKQINKPVLSATNQNYVPSHVITRVKSYLNNKINTTDAH